MGSGTQLLLETGCSHQRLQTQIQCFAHLNVCNRFLRDLKRFSVRDRPGFRSLRLRPKWQNITVECWDLKVKTKAIRKHALQLSASEFLTFSYFQGEKIGISVNVLAPPRPPSPPPPKKKQESRAPTWRGGWGESCDSLSSASSPTVRCWNLRRSANLGSDAQGRIWDSSPTGLPGALPPSSSASSHVAERSVNYPSQSWPAVGYNKSRGPQPSPRGHASFFSSVLIATGGKDLLFPLLRVLHHQIRTSQLLLTPSSAPDPQSLVSHRESQ